MSAMAIGYALGVQYSPLPFCGSGRVRTPCRQRRGVVSMSVQRATKKVVEAEKLLSEFRQAFATPLPLLHQVADALVHEMNAGLASEGGSDQLKMLPTYVENLPSGCVHLNFLLSNHLLPLFDLMSILLDLYRSPSQSGVFSTLLFFGNQSPRTNQEERFQIVPFACTQLSKPNHSLAPFQMTLLLTFTSSSSFTH